MPPKPLVPAPVGDVEVAYRTTGIPNIKVYLSLLTHVDDPRRSSIIKVNLLKIKSPVRTFASTPNERMPLAERKRA